MDKRIKKDIGVANCFSWMLHSFKQIPPAIIPLNSPTEIDLCQLGGHAIQPVAMSDVKFLQSIEGGSEDGKF